MIFEHDVHVPHRGGLWLSGNIYRPKDSDTKPVPIICSLGPYNKERHATESDPFETKLLARQGPTVVYERFEGEEWVKHSYAVVHLDTPGTGLSPGKVDVFSMRDLEYYYDAIEWLATQPWCDGQVASCGLSYHSYTSMGVATLNPPSLKAIISWEVGTDLYRSLVYPGGIRNSVFVDWWFNSWVMSQQRAKKIRTYDDLKADFVDFVQLGKDHPHNDDFWKARTPVLSNINIPFYHVINLCGHPISTNSHLQLMSEAATPKNKQWLDVISGKHVKPMYDVENIRSQRRFLDYILKGSGDGWDKVPRVKYAIRGRYDFKSHLFDESWPPSNTENMAFALDANTRPNPTSEFSTIAMRDQPKCSLTPVSTRSIRPGVATYHNEKDDNMFIPAPSYAEYLKNVHAEERRPGSSVAFFTPPFRKTTLISGQSIVTLYVSVNDTTDTDIFLCLRYICKDDHEVLFDGILDSPNLPVALASQRLSKRKIDESLSSGDCIHIDGSTPEPAVEGEVIAVRIMLSPVSVIVEEGGRLVLEVSSRNAENSYCYIQCDPEDRKMGGSVNIHTGRDYLSQITLPFQNRELSGLPAPY